MSKVIQSHVNHLMVELSEMKTSLEKRLTKKDREKLEVCVTKLEEIIRILLEQ